MNMIARLRELIRRTHSVRVIGPAIIVVKRIIGRTIAALRQPHIAHLREFIRKTHSAPVIGSAIVGVKRMIGRTIFALRQLHPKRMIARFIDGFIRIINQIYLLGYKGFERAAFWKLAPRRPQPDGAAPGKGIRSVLQVSLISHQPYMLSRLLRRQGIKAEYLALNADLCGRLNIGYDYSIPSTLHPLWRRVMNSWYLWRVMVKYDVIHYHFNAWLTPDGHDLAILKGLGKVLVFHFRGCDVRRKSVNMALNPDLNCCQECDYPEGSCDTEWQMDRINTAFRYADCVLVTTPDLLDFAPSATHIPFTIPYGIDIDSITPAPRAEGVFRVVTSSNHHGVDGTPHVRDAVSRLREEGKSIELVEVHDMNYMDALAVYKSADLYAGKLMMGYYNNANIETMLMGVPNMSYIREKYLRDIPDCPIIIARPETVYDQLRNWIDRPEELRKLGKRSREFVLREHDPGRVARMIIDKYNEALATRLK
ncbi:MAG: hypothetical protein ACNS63_00695 [Candidatus Nitrospinota bacterium M3_3B_026]